MLKFSLRVYLSWGILWGIPIREQEGTDVRHWGGCRSELCQSHNVFKGDVGLSAHVHHMDFLREAMWVAAGGTPDDLHHNGVSGSPKGLHSLIVAGLGQLLPINLRMKKKNQIGGIRDQWKMCTVKSLKSHSDHFFLIYCKSIPSGLLIIIMQSSRT